MGAPGTGVGYLGLGVDFFIPPKHYKFEGKERDTETGNDDFGARYYSNRFGRWLSADWSSVPVAVPYANLTNPQTLNLYSMVADDPESFADLDGHVAFSFPGLLYPGSGGLAEGLSCESHPDSCETAEVQAAATQTLNQQNANQQQPQEQKPEQPQGENQPNQPNQPQQPEPPKPPSWDPKKPLPGDPKDLGPDWQRDRGHRAPNDERYVNPNGDKLDWHKGIPGEKGWKGKDHWHWNEHDWHFKPGDTVRRVATAIAVGVVAYWVVSEVSRLFPPRNLVPVP